MNQSLFAAVGEHLPEDLNKPFLRTPDGGGYSYAEMLRSSAQFAHALVELGVQPGDRVAVQVDKSPEAVMLYLGTLRAGAVYLPLNSGYTSDELSYFLGDAEPSLFVCTPAFEEQAGALAQQCGVARVASLGQRCEGSLMPHVEGKPGRFLDIERSADDLAAILYTSGTTGRSKGAMISHGNLVSNARALVQAWAITADDWLLHALPIFHIHGLFVAINSLLMAGAHDLSVFVGIDAVKHNWGIAEKDVKFHPYWENDKLIQTGDKKVLVGAYTRPRKVLLVVGNLNDAEANPTLTVDWKALGLNPKEVTADKVKALNYKNEVVPSRVQDGKITVTLPAENPLFITINS